jgi:hypothetical protein
MQGVFQALAWVAMGAYLIWFGRFSYSRPVVCIQRWQSFYWYLRAESPRSQNFLRAAGIFGIFAGVLFVAAAVSTAWNPAVRAQYFWGWILGSVVTTLILIPRR